MTMLAPALDAALAGPSVTIFGAIRADLPGRIVRLIVGSGVVRFPVDGVVEEFTGSDEVLGQYAGIETLTDGIGSEAPAIVITFTPASAAAAAQVASAAMQGSRVRIWLGAVDVATGMVIGVDQLIEGLLDVPTLKVTEAGRQVDYEVTSIFEDFFLTDEGARLNDAFHKYLWPGERGCEFVTYVQQSIYWGMVSPDGVSR